MTKSLSSVILARRAALCYTIHEIRAARKRTRHPSAPQNGILRQAQQGFHAQGFQNHIPVRGRKPVSLRLDELPDVEFQNHIPARGRKRLRDEAEVAVEEISKPHPRKGTETTHSKLAVASTATLISKPHPRKGTETDGLEPSHARLHIFQNHIPARGRKKDINIG